MMSPRLSPKVDRVKLRNCASNQKLKNVYHVSNLKVYSAQEDPPVGEDACPAGKSASKCKQEEENLHQNKKQKMIRMFNPLPLDARQNMAEALGLQIAKPIFFGRSKELTQPKRLHRTRGDGNCYFRAISYIFTGSEECHFSIRDSVV